jgi:hypothetical protein
VANTLASTFLEPPDGAATRWPSIGVHACGVLPTGLEAAGR